MSSLRRVAIIGGAVVAGVATAAIAAFVGIGVWLIAVIGGALLGMAATLVAPELADELIHASPSPDAHDPITGLPDSVQLETDLSRAMGGPRHVLLCYSLDGLRDYNNAYGGQCGDHLMRWLADKLVRAVGDRAVVYRRPGAGFAVLAAGHEETTDQIRVDASTALFEIGDGFAVWSTVGSADLPADAGSPAEAIEHADRRAHTPDASVPRDFSSVPRDPLGAFPQVRPHIDIGATAKRVARRLGVPPEELDEVEVAVHLRDIGNVALPSSLLSKPGMLDSLERGFFELHTIVGERLLASRFGMDGVGRIVRSSHERWDGSGYPDRLRGEQIPIGSRIVFVCSAYQDMTSQRAHRRALTHDEALTELARAAGSQFDGRVVKEFTGELLSAQRPPTEPVDVSSSVLRAVGPDSGAGSGDDTPSGAMRVLVADPNPVSRFLLRRGIGHCGHECVAVSDGEGALQTYSRAHPDVVIAAAELADVDGIELCRRIRTADKAAPELMLLTNSGQGNYLPDPPFDSVIHRPIVQRELDIRLRAARQAARLRDPGVLTG